MPTSPRIKNRVQKDKKCGSEREVHYSLNLDSTNKLFLATSCFLMPTSLHTELLGSLPVETDVVK